MKARLAALAALLVLASCGASVRAPGGADLEGLVDAWRRRTPVPAVVAMAAGPNIGERLVASGTLDPGGEEPVTPATAFRAASITKLIVAAVVVQLAGEGRLSLDDPAADHLDVGGALGGMIDGVAVRDLLGHTSGIPDAGRSPELTSVIEDDPDRAWSVEEVLEFVEGRDPEFEPGKSYGYSNTNYLLLGEVIESATGRPWHVEVRDRILDRVGMPSSYIAGLEEPRGALAPGYFDLDNDGATQLVPHPWRALETSEGAAGALVSTASDLVSFMEALTNGKLVSSRLLAEMTRPGPYSSRYTGYGLGVEVLTPDLQTRVWGHGGVVPGFRAVLWYVPSHSTTIVVLTNESRSRPDGLAELILRAVTR